MATLTFLVLVPWIATVMVWIETRSGPLLIVLCVSAILLLIEFFRAEWAIISMSAEARRRALFAVEDAESRMLVSTEPLLASDISEATVSAVETIKTLDEFRDMVAGRRVSVIAWDTIAIQILIPVLVGVCIVTCQIQMESLREALRTPSAVGTPGSQTPK